MVSPCISSMSSELAVDKFSENQARTKRSRL